MLSPLRRVAESRFVAPVEEGSPPEPIPVPAPPEPKPADYLLGKKISHHRIIQLLGGGGMGVVYKAEDLKLGRPVALKLLPAEISSDPIAFERLRPASALDLPIFARSTSSASMKGSPSSSCSSWRARP